MKIYAIISDVNNVLISRIPNVILVKQVNDIKDSIIILPYDFEYMDNMHAIDDIHDTNKIIFAWTNDSILKYDEMYSRYSNKSNVYYILDGTPLEKKKNNIFTIENEFLSESDHIIEATKIPSYHRNNTFFSLMGRAAKHRDSLINMLYKCDILTKGKIVYHCTQNINREILCLLSKPHKKDPFTKNFVAPINNKIRYDDIPIPEYYSKYNIELVVETTTKAHYITEKTVKPLSARMPFLCVSSPLYLEYLHKLGFKTFSTIFDESYDNIMDDNLRIQKIVSILSSLIDTNDIYNLYDATKEILEYNKDHLNWIMHNHSSKIQKTLQDIIKQVGK